MSSYARKASEKKGFFLKNKWDSSRESSVEGKFRKASSKSKLETLKSPARKQKPVDDEEFTKRRRNNKSPVDSDNEDDNENDPDENDEDDDSDHEAGNDHDDQHDKRKETEKESKSRPNPTKSPEEIIKSKFRRSPKQPKPKDKGSEDVSPGQTSKSKLTTKMINVWRRDSSRRKKGDKSDDEEENSEDEQDANSKTPNKGKKTSIVNRRQWASDKIKSFGKRGEPRQGQGASDEEKQKKVKSKGAKDRGQSSDEEKDKDNQRERDDQGDHDNDEETEVDKENYEDMDSGSTPRKPKAKGKFSTRQRLRSENEKEGDRDTETESEVIKRGHQRSRHFSDGSRGQQSEGTSKELHRTEEQGQHSEGESRRGGVISRISSSALDHDGQSIEESQDEKTSSKTILEDENFHMARHGLADPNLWNVVAFENPIHTTELEEEAWKNMIYYPSSGELSLQDKMPDDLSIRFLEDEGIFVGNPLELSKRNSRRLEHRIVTEKAFEWLGQNGKIVSFPSPYRPERIQLYHDEKTFSELVNSVSFKSAKMEPMQEFQLDPKMMYEIIVDVGSISFKHHPLFSKEHVLATRLENAYEEYNRRKELKLTERLQNKLKALRVALQHCKEAKIGATQKLKMSMSTPTKSVYKGSGSGDGHESLDRSNLNSKNEDVVHLQSQIEQLDERIRRYRQEMRKTRVERNQSWKDDKILLTTVLDSWKSLKSLRNHQEYISTTPKLNVMTTHEKFEVDKEVWAVEIEEEFEDVREEYEEEYAFKLQEYRSKMKEWTENRRRRKERRLKKSRRSKLEQENHQDDDEEDEDDEDNEKEKDKKGKSRAKGDNENESDEGSDNSESSVPSLTSKPSPPLKFDPELVRSDIVALFQDLKRLPGEPKISLELTKTAAITSKSLMPPNTIKELQRRKAVEKTEIEFKIKFNGRDLYTSNSKEFSPDFSVFMGLTIPIKVQELPKTLQLVITEVKSGHRSVVSNVQLPIPNTKTSIDRCHVQKIEFQTSDVVKTSHAGVGSGVPFSTNKEDNDGIFTCGYVTIRIGWTTDPDGNVLCPPGYDRLKDKEDLANFGLNTRELLQSGDIQKWSQNIQLDPNDPRNAKWIESVAKKIQRVQRRRSLGLIDETGDHHSLVDLDDDYNSRSSRGRSGSGGSGAMGEFDFCSEEELESSLRFKLLNLRDEEVPEFKNVTMVPPHDKDISARAFEEYERRLKEDARRKPKPGDSSYGAMIKLRKRTMDDDGDYELNRLERIREIRLKVLRLFESSLRQITFDDVIVEEQIPDIGTLGLNIMTLFQPRRPLRPTRRERKRVQGSSLADTKLTLIVNIVRAFNLPMRKDTDVGLLTTESVTGVPLAKKRTGSSAFPFSSYSTAKTFVEIWFQRNVCRTTTALGANPTWNQELQLNLVVPDNDYSQENLSKMDDLIYLLVYDEVAIDLLEDDRRRDTDIYQRLEKRWLGSITIPFSTLFTNGRIEGTFKLNSPTILLGYEAQGMSSNFMNPVLSSRSNVGSNTNIKDRFGTNPSSNINMNLNSQVNNQKNSFITLFMTLQPAVQKISTFKEESATGEANPEIRSHVKSWKMFYTKKFPERSIKPFVMNIEGETILCIRYLKPIPPPESLINPDADLLKNMEDISHFVSLFPSVRDSTLGISDYSLWVTSDVFVSSIGGGIEDHAVILACFFMHLQVPCWIVQGNAIPDGPTAYVVTTFKGQLDQKIAKNLKNAYLIWNPCTGDYYFANDNFCPLQKVWAVVGSTNMWANVSDYERPHQLDWDFNKASVWKPLFSNPMEESKLSSVQTAEITFKPSDQNQANSLAQRLERHLKDVFMKWRKTSKTKWNRSAAGILRRLLPRLEEIKSGKSRTQPRAVDGSTVADSVHSIISDTPSNFSEEHLMELRDVMTTYQMTGFPLQQPYINMESITESVFATGVHTIDTPNVEFAIAAYARSYPAGTYSVWLYIAALHRRK